MLCFTFLSYACLHFYIAGFKKTKSDEEEYDYEDGSQTLSASDQQKADEDMKRRMKGSSRRGSSNPRAKKGFFQRKLGNVGAALDAERRRWFGKQPSDQTHAVDAEDYGRRHTHATDHDEKSMIDKSGYSESVISAAQVKFDDDHVDANERIKAFQRRVSNYVQQKPESIEEESYYIDDSTASRPIVPTNINFSFDKKGSGKSSSSSSSSEEEPAKRKSQRGKKNAPKDDKGKRRSDPAQRKSRS